MPVALTASFFLDSFCCTGGVPGGRAAPVVRAGCNRREWSHHRCAALRLWLLPGAMGAGRRCNAGRAFCVAFQVAPFQAQITQLLSLLASLPCRHKQGNGMPYYPWQRTACTCTCPCPADKGKAMACRITPCSAHHASARPPALQTTLQCWACLGWHTPGCTSSRTAYNSCLYSKGCTCTFALQTRARRWRCCRWTPAWHVPCWQLVTSSAWSRCAFCWDCCVCSAAAGRVGPALQPGAVQLAWFACLLPLCLTEGRYLEWVACLQGMSASLPQRAIVPLLVADDDCGCHAVARIQRVPWEQGAGAAGGWHRAARWGEAQPNRLRMLLGMLHLDVVQASAGRTLQSPLVRWLSALSCPTRHC